MSEMPATAPGGIPPPSTQLTSYFTDTSGDRAGIPISRHIFCLMHVAMVPDIICEWACVDEKVFGAGDKQPVAETSADLTKALDKSIRTMKDTMAKLGDQGLMANWKATAGGNTIFEMPKVALIRSIALNHWYHHRGQLSVYLRLLDVPVPSIYGPSADEPPFRG